MKSQAFTLSRIGKTLLAGLISACLITPNTALAFLDGGENDWERLSDRQSILSTVDSDRYQYRVDQLTRNKKQLETLGHRAAPYLRYIIQQAYDSRIPTGLAILPMVESKFQPFAYSQVGATGLWQLMPGTASGYGLSLDWWYDARRDTIASTRAALSYLKYLHNYFHDWLLAIAAYNAGEGRILKAIHKNMKKHLPIDYWSLQLPKQTKNYVPTFLAYLEIFSHPDRYQLDIGNLPEELAWKKFSLPGAMHLSQIASMAGISVATLRTYNPGYRRDVTGPHYLSVLIPEYAADKMEEKLQALDSNDKPLTEWLHYKVRKGDTLSEIAAKHQTTTHLLKYVNHLKNAKLKIGQNLYIPLHKKSLLVPVAKHLHDMKIDQRIISESRLPGPKQLHYVVRRGDTRKRVARRFHVKEAQLIYWNGLSWNDRLIPGQHLTIWRKDHSSHRRRLILHKVRSGETLAYLARKYGTQIKTIKRNNHLTSSLIRIGEKLYV